MVQMKPMDIKGHVIMGIEVALPKTNLLILTTEKGYIMCGALDVDLLNEKLADREVVAGRSVGVRTLEDLLTAPLQMVTIQAEKLGVYPGMTGREALLKMM